MRHFSAIHACFYAFRACLIGAGALLVAIGAGCDPKPVEPDPPRVIDFDPNRGPRPEGSPAQVVFHKIELPHTAHIGAAWRHVTNQGIDPRDRATWQANGFRIGVLQEDKLGPFFEALGARHNDGASVTILPPFEETPLYFSGWVNSQRDVTLFFPPDSLRTERLRPGRYQFLVSASALQDMPGFAFRIIPHLHYRLTSLIPRTIDEQNREGRVFRPLSLNTVLSPDQYLVIAIDLPVKLRHEPEAPSVVPADAPYAEPTVASLPDADGADAPPPPVTMSDPLLEGAKPEEDLVRALEFEWKLADLVLGAQRFRQPIQTMLIIQAVPAVITPPPAPDPVPEPKPAAEPEPQPESKPEAEPTPEPAAEPQTSPGPTPTQPIPGLRAQPLTPERPYDPVLVDIPDNE